MSELSEGSIVFLKRHKDILLEVVGIEGEALTLKEYDTGMEIGVMRSEVGLCEGATEPHRENRGKVHILGTEYTIVILNADTDYQAERGADGLCDTTVKELQLFNFTQTNESVADLVAYQKKVLRHEILHAFLHESGLWNNSISPKAWAQNEEMVDWFAIQEPKIHAAYVEAGCAD